MRPLRAPLIASLCFSLVFAHGAWAGWQQNGLPVSAPPALQQLPAAIPDGAGGIIVVWQDSRGFDADIYAQRIDALGTVQWAPGGVAIAAVGGDQLAPKICPDGAGGALIAWEDKRSGDGIFAQRVDGQGVPQWTSNGVPVVDMDLASFADLGIVPDANGGAIIAGDYLFSGNQTIFAQRLDASGLRQWGSSGTFFAFGHAMAIAADDAGGAVLSWTKDGFQEKRIFAGRLNANGTTQWAAVALSPALSFADGSNVMWVAGSGAVVAWQIVQGASTDLFAQELNPAGVAQWAVNGTPVSVAVGDQIRPQMVSDGGLGVILSWEDYRAGSANGDIFAQHLNSFGIAQWALNGVSVCSALNTQMSPSMVTDGAGGAIITWLDHRNFGVDVYAQRLASSGGGLWTFNGVPVATAAGNKAAPVIAPDGSSSAIVAWPADSGVPPNVYAERIEFKYGYWGHPEPIVSQVADAPLDQGGLVHLYWQGSQLDVAGGSQIDHYSIWVSAEGLPHPFPWTEVGTVSATGQPDYEFDVHTLSDATSSDPAVHQFQVVAHSAGTLDYSWPSNVMDGFSLDNLAPGAPASLSAQRLATGDVSLQWNGVTDADLDHYAVYRSSAAGVTPTAANFLAVSPGTTFLDSGAPSGALHYMVTAVDVHGNQGSSSNEVGVSGPTAVGDTPLLTTLTVGPNQPNPFSGATELEIGLPRVADISVEIFDVAGRLVNRLSQKGARAGWRHMQLSDRDGAGRALASGVYFYRVSAGTSTVTRKMVIAH